MNTVVPCILALCGLVLGAGACSSSGASPDAGSGGAPHDASVADSDAGPGDTVGTCTPSPGFAGNSKNVGAYCSQNGGQCGQYGNVLVQCSIDLDPAGSDFCVLIGCQADTDCGEDACCTGRAGVSTHACVPSGCFDAGACPGIPQ